MYLGTDGPILILIEKLKCVLKLVDLFLTKIFNHYAANYNIIVLTMLLEGYLIKRRRPSHSQIIAAKSKPNLSLSDINFTADQQKYMLPKENTRGQNMQKTRNSQSQTKLMEIEDILQLRQKNMEVSVQKPKQSKTTKDRRYISVPMPKKKATVLRK